MSQKKDEVTKVTEWNRPETTGKIPSKRSGHTLSLVESSIYLFGGCTAHASNGKPGTTNELFCLDISRKLPLDSANNLFKHARFQVAPHGKRV